MGNGEEEMRNKKSKSTKAKKKVGRHTYGPMAYHGSFEDGTYQTCTKCGATRFQGDRYAYMRIACR